jgi:wyosine [tRNA(Phe)-imidazoG37] synthetase (radical SAM superfamily)
MLLELQRDITYGPVRSRRLGCSLGVNLLPADRKLCSFNCLYCQYGWTRQYAPRVGEHELPDTEAVAAAVSAALARLQEPPAFITFSGNGEPTLHPDFPAVVAAVRAVRARCAPAARLAILSNSAGLVQPAIRSALRQLDLRIMKLDAGTPAMFQQYNGPAPWVDYEAVLAGLSELAARGPVVLQALFAGGPAGNATPDHVAAWVGRVVRIRPSAVQVYSLDRDAPTAAVTRLDSTALHDIRRRLAAEGVAAEVFGSPAAPPAAAS